MLARLLLTCLCAATPVMSLAAAAPATPARAAFEVDTVREADALLDLLKRSMWASSGLTERDAAGRTMQEDVSELTLTDDTLEEFAKLRARMIEAHGEDGALPPMLRAAFSSLMERETCRRAAISSYWGPGQEAAIHEAMIRSMHERLKSDLPLEAEFEALRKRDQITRDTMMRRLAGCASAPTAWTPVSFTARADYIQLRARYAALIDAATAEGRLPIHSLEREAPCPAAAPPRQGDNKARVRSPPDVGRYYPTMDRMLMIEGLVRVRVEWDSTGCVLRTVVFASSGSESLDSAALRAALELSMDPMTIRGVPQADASILPVRFSLKNE